MLANINDKITQLIDAPPSFASEHYVQLRELVDLVARLETTMAAVAVDASCGDVVGSSRPEAFFIEHLSMSRSQVRALLRRVDGWREFPELRQSDLSSSAQDEVLRSVDKLDNKADAADLVAEALECGLEAPDALRAQLKKSVRDCNARNSKDPFSSERRRHLTLSRPDHHGGAHIRGYLPARIAALLKANLDSEFRAGAGRSEGIAESEDNRTVAQRMCDAFGSMIGKADSLIGDRRGHAALVVSMLDSDFSNLDLTRTFPTNTGFDLTALDIARMASAVTDYFTLHEADGQFLSMTTAERCATFAQRVALLTTDLVCQHPGCDCPATECDVHHILAWIQGGGTDIENLALLCRKHHRDNDDTRSKPNRGYLTRHPHGTSRHFNNSATQNNHPITRHSAVNRLRRRKVPPDNPMGRM